MALVKFERGNKSALPSAMSDGKIYIASDTQEMYVDVSSSNRIRISDIIPVASEGELPLAPLDKFYYAQQEAKLFKYQDSDWVEIGGVANYNELSNRPSIGGITLEGSLSAEDLGLQPAGNYLTSSSLDVDHITFWQDDEGGSSGDVTIEGNPLTYWQNLTGTWNAVCTAGEDTYNLVLADTGVDVNLNYFTLRFIAPNNYQNGFTFTFDGKVYTADSAEFETDQVVLLNFNKNNNKCYFSAGVGGGGGESASGITLDSTISVPHIISPGDNVGTSMPTLDAGDSIQQVLTDIYNWLFMLVQDINNLSAAAYVVQATAPTNTKQLWVDTSSTPNVLKYYNGSAWTGVVGNWG